MRSIPRIVYWVPDDYGRSARLYLNITNRCSNNCYFCFKNYRKGVWGFNLELVEDPSPKEVVNEINKFRYRKNWEEIVFCGFGEPTARLDCILEVSKWAKLHFKKIVRINTNGQGSLLNEGRKVMNELKDSGVDKMSVSLNAQNAATYNQVCKPSFENAFESVLNFIEEAKKENIDVEITAVTIPEVAVSEVRELARRMGVKFRKRDYVPCFW